MFCRGCRGRKGFPARSLSRVPVRVLFRVGNFLAERPPTIGFALISDGLQNVNPFIETMTSQINNLLEHNVSHECCLRANIWLGGLYLVLVDATLQLAHCWYGLSWILCSVLTIMFRNDFGAAGDWIPLRRQGQKMGNRSLYCTFFGLKPCLSSQKFVGPYRPRHRPMYRSARGEWLLPRVPLDVYGKLISVS